MSPGSSSRVVVPDIGDFDSVPVIEILVSVGDEVSAEDPLVTLESDKATMDVPAPFDGVVEAISVSVGDTVSEGSELMTVTAASESEPASEDPTGPPASEDGDHDFQLVVLGSGPGGYTAAFRAADLGLSVALVERHERLGGVCLNVGCIPSKALLHAARVVAETEEMAEHGISFGSASVDLDRLIGWKQSVVDRLTGGLGGLAKQRKVEVIHGVGAFTGPHSLSIDGSAREVTFDHCVIAAGSESARIPDLPDDPRVIDSTGALSPDEIPKRMLVVGGGIIGLEMACVYDALGSKVTVVEMMDQLIPGADPDLVRPLRKRLEGRGVEILLSTRVGEVRAQKNGVKVSIGDGGARIFDRVLVAVGRVPNGHAIGADAAGVSVSDRGFIEVDAAMRTNVPHISAIGDVVGGPMLAHKATHEAKVAAEAIAGEDVVFDARAIPSVAYTDPEVAWAGLTETAAKAEDVPYEVQRFPWAASGRALGLGRSEGLTKLLVEPDTGRVLGCGIVGVGAGDLIAEAVLAIEMGADAQDVALTVHPHPTLSETVAFAAELVDGSITDLMPPPARA